MGRPRSAGSRPAPRRRTSRPARRLGACEEEAREGVCETRTWVPEARPWPIRSAAGNVRRGPRRGPKPSTAENNHAYADKSPNSRRWTMTIRWLSLMCAGVLVAACAGKDGGEETTQADPDDDDGGSDENNDD